VATVKQKISVGFFMLICAAALAGVLIMILTKNREPTYDYFIKFNESISGLSREADVLYKGVPIGKVRKIDLGAGNMILVRVSIRKDVPIRKGMEAKLNYKSIATGQKIIDLTSPGGATPGEILKPGSDIPVQPSFLTTLEEKALLSSDLVYEIIGKVNTGLGEMEEGQLTKLVKDADDLVLTWKQVGENANKTITLTNEALAENRENIRKATERLEPLIAKVEQKVDTLDVETANKTILETADETKELIGKLQTATVEFDKTVVELRRDVANLEYEMRQSLTSLRLTLASVRRLVDYLERDPSSMLRGRLLPKEEAMEERGGKK